MTPTLVCQAARAGRVPPTCGSADAAQASITEKGTTDSTVQEVVDRTG